MIRVVEHMPRGTIGVEASGKITEEDYRDVLVPTVEAALATGDVRLLYVLDEGGLDEKIHRSAQRAPLNEEDEHRLRQVLEEHHAETGSYRAKQLLTQWSRTKAMFAKIVPRA